jgi:hypothetical protein
MMIFICNTITAQNLRIEIVINGNITYLDNLLEVGKINDFKLNELRILRNTIFAKYGYKFNSDDLTNHFSQFSWYEGNKTNVENELSSIDWTNIKLIQILENYYPTKIDYIFSFQHSGIYKLGNDFNLSPIFTFNNDNVRAHWAGSFINYYQFNDFLFFGRTQHTGKTLFFDYVTNYYFKMMENLHDIVSIYYQSKDTLVVNGSYYGRQVSEVIKFPNDRFKNEIIGTTAYISDKKIYGDSIYQGETYITYRGIYNFSLDGYDTYEPESVKEHFLKIFGKNIIVILENSYLWIYQGQTNRSDPEHLHINIIYNDIYNIYYIMVINYGFMYR